MKGLITVLALLVVVGLTFFLYRTPAAPPAMSEAESAQHDAEVMQAIEDQFDGYRAALIGGNLQDVLSYWTEDMRLWGPGMNLGKTDFEATVRGTFESGAVFTSVEFTPFDTFIHGNVVYQIGQLDATVRTPDGESIEDHSHILAKWVQHVDGAWRMSRGLQGPVDSPEEG